MWREKKRCFVRKCTDPLCDGWKVKKRGEPRKRVEMKEVCIRDRGNFQKRGRNYFRVKGDADHKIR